MLSNIAITWRQFCARGFWSQTDTTTPRSRPSRQCARLAVEQLETRLAPAGLVFVDDDFAALAPGTLIADANPFAGGAQPATFGTDAFATILEGVNAADPAGTVLVNPHGPTMAPSGSYAESVAIDRDLTLRGASGIAGDVLIAPPAGNGIDISGSGTDVVIENLSVTGPARGIAANGISSVALTNVQANNNGSMGVNLENVAGAVTATNVTANGSGGTENFQVSSAASVTITGGSFSNGSNGGLRLNAILGAVHLTNVTADLNGGGAGLNVSADDVTIDGASSFSGNGVFGITGGVTNTLTVRNVTANSNGFSGLNVTASNFGSSVASSSFNNNGSNGILVQALGRLRITDNTTNGNPIGVNIAGGRALLQANNLNSNTEAGLVVQNGGGVDAGQDGLGTNFSGLGISTGGNDFSLYANFARAFGEGGAAIKDLNSGGTYAPAGPNGFPFDVLAENNLFAFGSIESLIDHDGDDPNLGHVEFSRIEIGTTTTLTINPNPAVSGDPVTLMATVDAGAGNPTPAGSVTFIVDGVSLGPVTLSGGTADLTLPFALLPGEHFVTAEFGTTPGFQGSLDTRTLVVHAAEPPIVVGGRGEVRIFNQDGSVRQALTPFPGFTGEVRVAAGDVNGDGVPDIVAAPGKGFGPQVVVFDGRDYSPLASFAAYDPEFTGGVFVAVGNFDADPGLEAVTGQGKGGEPRVRIFDIGDGTGKPIAGPLGDFLAYDAGYAGGVTVAAGDFSSSLAGDEVIVGKQSGNPRVRVYGSDGKERVQLADFQPFGATTAGGVFVAAGDLDGDGLVEIIAGRAKGRAKVKLYNDTDASFRGGFTAYPRTFTGGLRVGTLDRNNDGRIDTILTGPGNGRRPDVKLWDSLTLSEIDRFFAFDSSFRGGVFVAGSAQATKGSSGID